MPFEPAPIERVRPVDAVEVIEPTRVSWRLPNGLLTSRVVPTAARAYELAAGLPEGSILMIAPATSPAPKQDRAVNKRFAGDHRRARSVRAGIELAAAYRDAGIESKPEYKPEYGGPS
jgi:hypothetical protein